MFFSSILNEIDTRQLFIDAVHLYGVMLFMMDNKIEGPARERILIAIYRSKVLLFFSFLSFHLYPPPLFLGSC
jgi:hypothetical protein